MKLTSFKTVRRAAGNQDSVLGLRLKGLGVGVIWNGIFTVGFN